MFIEKVITQTKIIFDPEIFKIGTKIHAKYKSDDYEYWEHDFIGIVKYYDEDTIWLEDPDDWNYDIFSDKPHPRQYKIELKIVKMGFWVIDLL